MNLNIENVNVTNWSKEPFLSLGRGKQAKLGTAIRYARQMVNDACELLATYEHAQIVASVDAQMAKDYFGIQTAVPEALEKYFGLDLTQQADKAKVSGIRARYKQIQGGIAGNFDIVVGHVHDTDDVKDGLKDAFRSLRHGSLKDAWGHIKFIREGTGGWVRNGTTQGRIHLNVERLDSFSEGKVARIIVHEASHKFANTDDVDLLSDGTNDGSGYKWDGLKHNARGYVGLENNADSYAWGARLMWKRKRGLRSGV